MKTAKGAAMTLYHYFDKRTGPFRNLSDLPPEGAQSVLADARRNYPASQPASRDENYMQRRYGYEETARRLFADMGGKIEREAPHFLCVEECAWLYTWYEQPAYVAIPFEEFDASTLSFTYGDLHPTFSPIVTDGLEYRRKLYMLDGITDIIARYGLPQTHEYRGELGFPRYVEAHAWSDETVRRFSSECFWQDAPPKKTY
ncbi:MAG: hypothetical protein QM689_10915 [Oscillospiraceae bacterium]